MQRFPRFLVLAVGLGLIALASLGLAQPGQPKGGTANVDAFVARLMAFDKDGDGKLTKEEVTDERLLRLFERADANKDNTVTKEELVALATQEVALGGQPGGGQPGGGQPGGQQKDKGGFPGGFQKDAFQKDKGGFPKDGFGKDKGGFGKDKGGFPGGFGRPQPGVLLSAGMQERLKMTDDQKKQLEVLQKEIDGKLEKILTKDQRNQLKEMKEGPGGPPRP